MDQPQAKPKVIVVMPAYNASKTLRLTYADLPSDLVDTVILVDDASSDETLQIARELGLEAFVHTRNYGYGANQKTCYREALKSGADIIVMLHPDYQYDPSLLPEMIAPIQNDTADVVLGSRLMGESPVEQGMPWWKFVGNRGLTKIQNIAYSLDLSEYHTGYRAYSRQSLEGVNFEMNSDQFIFDQEIITQFVHLKLRIKDIAVPTRYFAAASSISFWNSVRYGLSILWVLFRYKLHQLGVWREPRFDSLSHRYAPADR